jgi:hypothetical protein
MLGICFKEFHFCQAHQVTFEYADTIYGVWRRRRLAVHFPSKIREAQ